MLIFRVKLMPRQRCRQRIKQLSHVLNWPNSVAVWLAIRFEFVRDWSMISIYSSRDGRLLLLILRTLCKCFNLKLNNFSIASPFITLNDISTQNFFKSKPWIFHLTVNARESIGIKRCLAFGFSKLQASDIENN